MRSGVARRGSEGESTYVMNDRVSECGEVGIKMAIRWRGGVCVMLTDECACKWTMYGLSHRCAKVLARHELCANRA